LLRVRCLTSGIIEIRPRCGRVLRAAAYAGQTLCFRLFPGEYALRLTGDTASSAFLDLRRPRSRCIFVTLPFRINTGDAPQSFTLSDATYRLPINGVLSFTSTSGNDQNKIRI
ncbi:MAG: hypothetical protein J5781_06375, partial [Clostridia bacterium]|nr:hypothetical protein [Clostridia bacterium]